MFGDRPVIGLVGGIGSGKSTVARLLGEMGALVVDSDALSRQALGEPAMKDAIRAGWGEGVFNAQGEVDRSALARIVFASPAERERLEGLIHPIVEAKRRAIFASAPEAARALVIDAPLLLEAGIDRECDALIFVDAPEGVRESRVRETRGWARGELAQREAAQIPLDQKRRRADHTVVNTGDLESLRGQVQAVFDHILSHHRPPCRE